MKSLLPHAVAACFILAGPAMAGNHLKLLNGRSCQAERLRVVLRDDYAGQLGIKDGRARAVNTADIVKLHPAILRVEGRHLSSRNWLKGEAVPAHIKRMGKVPKTARALTFILKPGSDTLAVVKELRGHPQVESAYLKMSYRVDSNPDDTEYPQQWGMQQIGVPDGDWDLPGRGLIRVAIVDTGIDLQHPDLASRIVYQNGYGDFSNGDAPTDRRNRFDHGTHVAGIAAAIRNNSAGVAGVSNNIRLMAMGCASWSSSADPPQYLIDDADDAIDDAVDNGARVINCSFSPKRSDGQDDLEGVLNDSLDNAWDHNVLVVVSAGNDGLDITNHYWVQSGVPFIVTASEPAGPAGHPEVRWDKSNTNSRVNICAPGDDIFSTVPSGGPAGSPLYDYMDGTSMAAPHVAGAAALIMSMNPDRIEDHSARHILNRMARDAGPIGPDHLYGQGLLRIQRDMLQALRDADVFVGNTDFTGPDLGNYDAPLADIPPAVAAVPEGGTIVLTGGDVDTRNFSYPPVTITKKCVLTVLPGCQATIGAGP